MNLNDVNSLSHTKWNCKYHIVFKELEKRYLDYQNASRQIWPLIEQNDPSVEDAYMEVCKYDLAFHEQIVIMAHNDFLRYAFSLVQNSVSLHIIALSMRRIGKVKGGNIDRFIETTNAHKDQLDAIISKDKALFRKAYNTMVDSGY